MGTMKATTTYRLAVVAALASYVLALFGADANAQSASSYPEKAIRIIVPFPAGGATDIIARVVGERLSGAWNRPVVIENISGAAGAAGTAAAAKAAPDGYSLLTATGTTTTLLPHLRRNLPYDPLRDFDAVSLLCSFANILVVRPDGRQDRQRVDRAGAGEPGKIHLRQLRLRRFAASVG